MNYYVIVEGVAEKKIYERWITYVNPNLSMVKHFSDFTDNNFVIIMGGGYPNYLSLVSDGIEDIRNSANSWNIKLVCAGDSEELTLEERRQEIQECVDQAGFKQLNYAIIVQHFCIEAWALGNRVVASRNPSSPEMKNFKAYFDVLVRDPELLTAQSGGTRANYAALYLRTMLREKSKTAIYSKGDPSILYPKEYFNQLKLRREQLNHIASFDSFSNAFI